MQERSDLLQQKGVTIWLTGLSASGKVRVDLSIDCELEDDISTFQSTIACALEQHLLHLRKFSYRLDGDNIRFGLNKDLGFDEKSRNENIRRIGEVSRPFAVAPVTFFILSSYAGLQALHVKFLYLYNRLHLTVPRRSRPRTLTP